MLGLPGDGLGALPLLRHLILVDGKASTYKIGLLRVLARIADTAAGLARYESDLATDSSTSSVQAALGNTDPEPGQGDEKRDAEVGVAHQWLSSV